MKISWGRGLLILSVFFSLALKKDDVVELEQFLNARESADFLKTTQNVKFVLPPGTQAKIEKVKTFNSGNHGLYVTLQTGDSKGEKVWIYYRDEKPGMKLYEGEAAKSAVTTDVEKAQSAEMTEPTTAWRTPAGEKIPLVVTKEYAEQLMKKVDNVNAKLKEADSKNNKPCDDDCKLAEQTYGRDLPKPEDEEAKEQAKPKPAPKRKPVLAAGVRDENAKPVAKKPAKLLVDDNELPASPSVSYQDYGGQDAPLLRSIPYTENRSGIDRSSCPSSGKSYSLCSEGGKAPTRINVVNSGPNKAVPHRGLNFYRDWNFDYPGQARQDIGIRITDDRTGTNSALQESYIMVFPRTTLPTVREDGIKQIVTLANGETVTFDKRNNEIIGGVLKENGPMGSRPPNVTYGGKGLMIRADAQGKDARASGQWATVTKQDPVTKTVKSCKVPKKALWSSSSNTESKFKFFSDKDLDAYLKSQKQCGFGVFD